MFGFKRRARERELAQQSVVEALHAQLCHELQDVATSALSETPKPSDRESILDSAEAIRRGIDAVLVDGADAFGPEMAEQDQPTRCGALIAHSARNLSILSGPLSNSNTRGDIAHGLGLSRDAV